MSEDFQLVSIDAETPLAEIVALAAADIANRKALFERAGGVPLEGKDVRALCDWGGLLNAVAKDHAKLFEDRLKKLDLAALEKVFKDHPVAQAAKAVAAKKAKR